MIKPNLFIVGAPKCGTTSLATYLGRRPDVWMSDPKEPHHFAPAMHYGHGVASRAEYLALFAGGAGRPVIGEASVWYLYSAEGLRAILDFQPAAKLIVMLRDPLTMLPSLHAQRRFSCHQGAADFGEAWRRSEAVEAAWRRGEATHELNLKRLGAFAEPVAALLAIAPPERVLFIDFADFVSDTAAAYGRVLDFLGLPPEKTPPAFEIHNARKRHRVPLLGWVYKRTAAMLPMGVRRFSPRLRSLAHALRDQNVTRADRVTPPAETVAAMREYYREDVERLRALTGLPLRTWLADTTAVG